MSEIIQSILDTDLYKLTMGQAILKLFPGAKAEYRFIDRDPGTCAVRGRFSKDFVDVLRGEINEMAALQLTPVEAHWLYSIPFLEPWYIQWLKQFRFDPDQVDVELDDDCNLQISIFGPWAETIYWEVPLLSMVSEIFAHWDDDPFEDSPTFRRAEKKILKLYNAGCKWAEFGTRRRRSRVEQDAIVERATTNVGSSCVGTSNVHLAMKHGAKVVGTMAHEWVMGVGALRGLRYANRYAMDAWNDVYRGQMGIALTDTYGTDDFFRRFDTLLSKAFDGVRQDSGDPMRFIFKTVEHYKAHGIDPAHKTIVFSDGLNVERCIELKAACEARGINCSFGIGTNMTNDDPDDEALNIVIKLHELDGIKVAKLSDVATKATGDPNAIKEAKYVFLGDDL